MVSFLLLLKKLREKNRCISFFAINHTIIFFIQALHPLLEDGCPDDEEYEDYKKVYNRNIIYTFAEKKPVKLFFEIWQMAIISIIFYKVSFIGISNWALDPAKMNRGILVQREVPDEQDLIESAR